MHLTYLYTISINLKQWEKGGERKTEERKKAIEGQMEKEKWAYKE